MKRAVAGAIFLLVLVVGCNAAARLKVLQAPSSPAASAHGYIPAVESVARPPFQKGVDVDVYTYPGQNFPMTAAAVVSYVKKLGANSIAISFPFFMSGPRSLRVFATKRTPTPGQLASIVQAAEGAGLYVSLRPLLDEGSLGKSRVLWRPVNLAAWFGHYWRFLRPYVRMAQANKVPQFVVGAEFSQFGRSPLWNRLDRKVASVFTGRLVYSNNDTTNLSRASGGLVALKGVDLYHPIHPPFLRGWKAFDRYLPHGAIATEVGIAAVNGAWAKPWVHRWPASKLNLTMQSRWFTAACKAAMDTRLGGIYFWALPFSARPTGPTLKDEGAWANSPGAAAIARCYLGHA